MLIVRLIVRLTEHAKLYNMCVGFMLLWPLKIYDPFESVTCLLSKAC